MVVENVIKIVLKCENARYSKKWQRGLAHDNGYVTICTFILIGWLQN